MRGVPFVVTEDFEMLGHTADVGIRAFGTDTRSVYRNAARGLFSLIVDPRTVRVVEEERVTVKGSDAVDLLVAWLHEILYRFDGKGRVCAEVNVIEAGETVLRAVLRGSRSIRLGTKRGRKSRLSPSLARARVEQARAGLIAEVFLDV